VEKELFPEERKRNLGKRRIKAKARIESEVEKKLNTMIKLKRKDAAEAKIKNESGTRKEKLIKNVKGAKTKNVAEKKNENTKKIDTEKGLMIRSLEEKEERAKTNQEEGEGRRTATNQGEKTIMVKKTMEGPNTAQKRKRRRKNLLMMELK